MLQGRFVIVSVDSCKQRPLRRPFRFTDSDKVKHTLHTAVQAKHALILKKSRSLKYQTVGENFILGHMQRKCILIVKRNVCPE